MTKRVKGHHEDHDELIERLGKSGDYAKRIQMNLGELLANYLVTLLFFLLKWNKKREEGFFQKKMNNREYDKFFDLVRLRVPIAEVRSKYDAKQVTVGLSVYLDILFTSLNRYPFSMEWLKDYLIYIFDEGALNVNETYPGTFLTPLDFAMLHLSGNVVGVVVDFLLVRGATSCNSTSSLLNRYYNRYGYNDVLFKRLIDAGATPPFEGSIPSQLYHSRLATRSVCIALLSLPWKLPLGQGVRHWLPRDVLRVVGKMIWSQRFEYKGRVL